MSKIAKLLEEFENISGVRTFYLYAGYYELFISGHELPSPYMYQYETNSLDDMYDFLCKEFSDGEGGFDAQLFFTKDIEKDVMDSTYFGYVTEQDFTDL